MRGSLARTRTCAAGPVPKMRRSHGEGASGEVEERMQAATLQAVAGRLIGRV